LALVVQAIQMVLILFLVPLLQLAVVGVVVHLLRQVQAVLEAVEITTNFQLVLLALLGKVVLVEMVLFHLVLITMAVAVAVLLPLAQTHQQEVRV
jgi:hypothetical protein